MVNSILFSQFINMFDYCSRARSRVVSEQKHAGSNFYLLFDIVGVICELFYLTYSVAEAAVVLSDAGRDHIGE